MSIRMDFSGLGSRLESRRGGRDSVDLDKAVFVQGRIASDFACRVRLVLLTRMRVAHMYIYIQTRMNSKHICVHIYICLYKVCVYIYTCHIYTCTHTYTCVKVPEDRRLQTLLLVRQMIEIDAGLSHDAPQCPGADECAIVSGIHDQSCWPVSQACSDRASGVGTLATAC